MAEALPQVFFDFALEHGRCVGVRIPEDGPSVDALGANVLVDDEQAFAAGLAPLRRRTWIGGRVAMRVVLARLGVQAPAVLVDERGAPSLPAGIVGSISHKGSLAVALVSLAHSGRASGAGASPRVGVDLEMDLVGEIDISSHVLAEDEVIELAGLDPPTRGREVILRFSAKEAIYKALDPFVRRYVQFHEVSVSPDGQGGTRITQRLRPGEGPFSLDARWRRFDGLVLTSARVAPASRA